MNYDSRIDAPIAADTDSDENPLLAGDAEDRETRRRLWIIGAVVAALLVAVWFFTHRSAAGDEEKKVDKGPVVSVITPGRTTIARS